MNHFTEVSAFCTPKKRDMWSDFCNYLSVWFFCLRATEPEMSLPEPSRTHKFTGTLHFIVHYILFILNKTKETLWKCNSSAWHGFDKALVDSGNYWQIVGMRIFGTGLPSGWGQDINESLHYRARKPPTTTFCRTFRRPSTTLHRFSRQ